MAAVITACLCLLLPAVSALQLDTIECVFTGPLQEAEPHSRATNGLRGELRANGTVLCPGGARCYGLWEKRADGEMSPVQQGCWSRPADPEQCSSDLCRVKAAPPGVQRDAFRFCCCGHALCNANFTEAPPTDDAPPRAPLMSDGLRTGDQLLVVMVTVALVAVAVLMLFLGCHMIKGKPKILLPILDPMKAPNHASVLDLDHLKLQELIGRGRYGTVFRGSLGERHVAVKLFGSAHKRNFANERSIYASLPVLHDNVARFLSADERTSADGQQEYLIVLEFYPHGSLCNFLSGHCVDWWTGLRMSVGVTRGLAFLHTEVIAPDQYKPALAHRDLSSRNILVRSDLSCVLADFGLSMRLTVGGAFGSGEEDGVAIAEAGTVRYMAPEVLGGALNLRDCESALKQVDVYALGLVYWETFRRCRDLFPDEPVPEFQLAFQEELGNHPSLEQMRVLVVRQKLRPRFPEAWKENSALLRSLKETMEDCWDQDAEARLSAQCAEERLCDLTLMTSHRSPHVGSASSCIQDLQFKNLHVGGAKVTEKNAVNCDQQQANGSGSRAAPGETSLGSNQTNWSQRPSSLHLAPEVKEKVEKQRNHRQVETGVAKMNTLMVAMAAKPHMVTTVTNTTRGTDFQATTRAASSYCAGISMPRTNGGVANLAGPQPEEGHMTCITFSSDDQEPLLPRSPEAHPDQQVLLGQGSNSNNNNNRVAPGSHVLVQGSEIQPDKMKGLGTSGSTSELPEHITAGDGDLVPGPALASTLTLTTKAPLNPSTNVPNSDPKYKDTDFGSVKSSVPASEPEDSFPSSEDLIPEPEVSETSIKPEPRRTRTRTPERPRSLDMSLSDLPPDEAPPPLDSASPGEKIKRRVKTPYTLKKWRPVSWVLPTDSSLDLDFDCSHSHSDPGLPDLVQSKSSAAGFLVRGGATETMMSDSHRTTSF